MAGSSKHVEMKRMMSTMTCRVVIRLEILIGPWESRPWTNYEMAVANKTICACAFPVITDPSPPQHHCGPQMS